MIRSLGLERVVVDAQDDRGVELVLGRGAQDDPLGAGVEVLLEGGLVGEEAGRLEGDLAASSAFQGRLAGSFSWVIRISLPLTIRDCLARLDRPLERPVDAVVLQEQGQVLGVRQVVDRDDLEVVGPRCQRRKTSRPIRPNPLIPTRTAIRPTPAFYEKESNARISAPAILPLDSVYNRFV